MQKAFIFDVDGVIINDETIWNRKKNEIFNRLLGADITSRLGMTQGVHFDLIYEKAKQFEATIS